HGQRQVERKVVVLLARAADVVPEALDTARTDAIDDVVQQHGLAGAGVATQAAGRRWRWARPLDARQQRLDVAPHALGIDAAEQSAPAPVNRQPISDLDVSRLDDAVRDPRGLGHATAHGLVAAGI